MYPLPTVMSCSLLLLYSSFIAHWPPIAQTPQTYPNPSPLHFSFPQQERSPPHIPTVLPHLLSSNTIFTLVPSLKTLVKMFCFAFHNDTFSFCAIQNNIQDTLHTFPIYSTTLIIACLLHREWEQEDLAFTWHSGNMCQVTGSQARKSNVQSHLYLYPNQSNVTVFNSFSSDIRLSHMRLKIK